MMSEPASQWYILQQPDGHCVIQPAGTDAHGNEVAPDSRRDRFANRSAPALKCWGPYPSQADAIAKRVGLIRAGHCQPQ